MVVVVVVDRLLVAIRPLRRLAAVAMLAVGARTAANNAIQEARCTTPHAFTARMCAASRFIESERTDSLFTDPLAKKLAGQEGMDAPMGSWIMVPRTRYGDDFLREHYSRGCRQLVLLGAGMDARAYRMKGLEQLAVFEVDQKTIFDVKEPLLKSDKLAVAKREVVPTEFTEGSARWKRDILAKGFDPQVPTVWLLEGLLMYLSMPDTHDLMRTMGALSAPGSAVFHDACSARYITAGIVVGGAPFIGGSDEYTNLWAQYAGFDYGLVRDFRSISVDRARRRVLIDPTVPEATTAAIRGRDVVLFVEVSKGPANATGQ